MDLEIAYHKSISFIYDQIAQVYQGGALVFFKKVGKLLSIIPHVLIALPIVILIRLLRPWVIVRFAQLHTSRIGHLAGIYELYLCERDAGMHSPKHHDIFYILPPICNYQLKKMYERVFNISSFAYSLSLANRCLPGSSTHIVDLLPSRDIDFNNFLSSVRGHFSFTPEELQFGENELKKIGIQEKAPFVSFMGRDAAYLNFYLPDRHWDYHNYRDMNIQNFILAAEELTQRGYFAIRMGQKVMTAISVQNSKVIDYATKYRTDFLDIYLAAKCCFFVNGMSGFDAVPMFLFRRPMVKINFIPLEGIRSGGAEAIHILKKLWLIKERRFMTFREIIESKACQFGLTEQYKTAGIEPIENTPEEIASAVTEMDERLHGTWQTLEEDNELQGRFWDLFKVINPYINQGGVLKTHIGAEFLRQNRELLK